MQSSMTSKIEVESIGSSAYDNMIFKKNHKFGIVKSSDVTINQDMDEDLETESADNDGKPLMTQNDRIFGSETSYDTAELNLKLLFHHSGSGSASMSLGRY